MYFLGTKHFELLKKEKVQLLLFLFFLAEIQISFSQSIQFLGNLTFPHDLSTQWIGGSSLATVGGSIQLWFSQSTLYIIKPNPLDKKHALTFVYNASIPEIYQPMVSLLSASGPDGEDPQFLIISRHDPTTLLELKLKMSSRVWSVVRSLKIPNLQSKPTWNIIANEEQESTNTVYFFAEDFIFSLYYPSWEIIHTDNITESVDSSMFPTTKVTGVGFDELRNALFVARAAPSTSQPGNVIRFLTTNHLFLKPKHHNFQLLFYNLDNFNGKFSYGFITFLDKSPENFDTILGGEIYQLLFWSQINDILGKGFIYRWDLQNRALSNINVSFDSSEQWSKAHSFAKYSSYAIYASGNPSQLGFTLRRVNGGSEFKFSGTLKEPNFAFPDLAVECQSSTKGNAIFGTFSESGCATLALYHYGQT